MNKLRVFILLLSLSQFAFAQLPDMMQIKVAGSTFQKRSFENGALLFTNKKYAIKSLPKAFVGFEFLASHGKVADEGSIIPSKAGLIYIIAPADTNIKGWLVVENSEFTYSDENNSKLSIYQKNIKANQQVVIPLIAKFPGASPLAKIIEYGTQTLQVKGKLIDIWVANAEEKVFPQNTTFKFESSLPANIKGRQYAVSLIENQGVNQVRSSSPTEIIIGLHYKTSKDKNWKYTGDSIAISSMRKYYIYTREYKTLNEWMDIPKPHTKGLVAPTLVFSDKLEVVNPIKVPGTVITQSQDIKNLYITNPSVVILPNGNYLASCSGALRNKGDKGGVSFFISSDKGKTWQVQSSNSVFMSFCNLFIHKGEVFLMGTNRGYKDAVISKSIDNGKTWTMPIDASNGLLLTGGFYHSAPVTVVVNNGRIWRAMENCETNTGKNKRALVMSASVDADLLKASSWTTTNELSFEVKKEMTEGHEFKQWLEGVVVVGRDGKVLNILRVDELKEGGFAAITHVTGIDKLTYDPQEDMIRFPGGGKKFTIRFDNSSNKYWAISNAEFNEDRVKTHSGKYKAGVHASLLRNRLVLMYSDDLRKWNVKDTLISSENPFFYGFQYTDWQFDGNDIIAVTRTAFEEERGLPMRQHDANFFTFYRFKNFRNSKIEALKPEVAE